MSGTMNTLVVGAAGRTGAHVLRLLLAADLGPVRGLVRRPDQAGAVAAFGAEAVLGDVTDEIGTLLDGVDALVYAVGAGQNGDPEAVDYAGTVALIEAAEAAETRRFVLISSMGTTYAERMPPFLKPHLIAKRKAEQTLERSHMVWTIVRPGGLNDDPGSGMVRLAPRLDEGGMVPREDVARVAVTALRLGLAERRAVDVVAGPTPIEQALRGLEGP
jgi:uncharacterized protein YbjT (DUF2867 family)